MKKAGRCWKEVGTWKKRTPQSFCFSSLKAGPSVCMKEKVIQLCPTLCDPMDYTYSPWNSPGQNTGVDGCSLLNLGLPHCRWILYQLSYQGNPVCAWRVAKSLPEEPGLLLAWWTRGHILGLHSHWRVRRQESEKGERESKSPVDP